MSLVTSAIDHIGLRPIASLYGFKASAVHRWKREGRLPRTDLMGVTHYAEDIERLSNGRFKAIALLAETRAAWQRRAAKGIRPGRRIEASLS